MQCKDAITLYWSLHCNCQVILHIYFYTQSHCTVSVHCIVILLQFIVILYYFMHLHTLQFEIIAGEEATKSLVGKKATIWKCISGRLERTVGKRVNRTALGFLFNKTVWPPQATRFSFLSFSIFFILDFDTAQATLAAVILIFSHLLCPHILNIHYSTKPFDQRSQRSSRFCHSQYFPF